MGDKGLPLGLVSSPALANLYMNEFDGLLYGKIKQMGLQNPIYTRYADDMVISYQADEAKVEQIQEIKYVVQQLLKKVHLRLNEKKTRCYDLHRTNHVRITGISITKSEENYRHISIGRKAKNQMFWDAVNMYDQENKDYAKINHLKGYCSFALSIEKKGIESCYSDQMMKLLQQRGCNSLKELIEKL